MRIRDWSSDLCSSDLPKAARCPGAAAARVSYPVRSAKAFRTACGKAAARNGSPENCGLPLFCPQDLQDVAFPRRVRHGFAYVARQYPPASRTSQRRRGPASTGGAAHFGTTNEIGRASCRERVGQYGSVSVSAVLIKKKNNT